MASGVKRKIVEERVETILRRKHMALVRVEQCVDNGGRTSGYYLVDERTGEREKTTYKKGQMVIFSINQLELF